MKVPYDEGVANHIGPESCAGGREVVREALTGVRVGQPLSDETLLNGAPMPSSRQKATWSGALSRAPVSSASSVDPGMRARLPSGNREVSGPPAIAEWRAAW